MPPGGLSGSFSRLDARRHGRSVRARGAALVAHLAADRRDDDGGYGRRVGTGLAATDQPRPQARLLWSGFAARPTVGLRVTRVHRGFDFPEVYPLAIRTLVDAVTLAVARPVDGCTWAAGLAAAGAVQFVQAVSLSPDRKGRLRQDIPRWLFSFEHPPSLLWSMRQCLLTLTG
jgi:hypothetical protein